MLPINLRPSKGGTIPDRIAHSKRGVQVAFFKRLMLVCAAICSGGCSLGMWSKAEYDKGIIFSGIDDTIHQLNWRPDGADASVHCPVIVHLKDGVDLDASHFESPDAMRRHGARTLNQYGDSFDLEMMLGPDMVLGCDYKRGKLLSVFVNVRADSKHKVSLTVDGKHITLPLSEKEFFKAMGEPRSFEKRKSTLY
jgi:hypothetical protein